MTVLEVLKRLLLPMSQIQSLYLLEKMENKTNRPIVVWELSVDSEDSEIVDRKRSRPKNSLLRALRAIFNTLLRSFLFTRNGNLDMTWRSRQTKKMKENLRTALGGKFVT